MVLCPLRNRENIYVSLLKSHSNPVASNIAQELPLLLIDLVASQEIKLALKAKNTFPPVVFYLLRLGQYSFILFFFLCLLGGLSFRVIQKKPLPNLPKCAKDHSTATGVGA